MLPVGKLLQHSAPPPGARPVQLIPQPQPASPAPSKDHRQQQERGAAEATTGDHHLIRGLLGKGIQAAPSSRVTDIAEPPEREGKSKHGVRWRIGMLGGWEVMRSPPPGRPSP